MNTPRFVVKRVGNDYKIVRAGAEGVVLSGLSTVVGSVLLLKGLRGGLIGKAIALAGGGLIYYGVTGENPIEALQKKLGCVPSKASSDSGPSFQHDANAKSDQRPEDEVDEASMESFPASDPPAHHHSTAATA